jgi:hypothetical protein
VTATAQKSKKTLRKRQEVSLIVYPVRNSLMFTLPNAEARERPPPAALIPTDDSDNEHYMEARERAPWISTDDSDHQDTAALTKHSGKASFCKNISKRDSVSTGAFLSLVTNLSIMFATAWDHKKTPQSHKTHSSSDEEDSESNSAKEDDELKSGSSSEDSNNEDLDDEELVTEVRLQFDKHGPDLQLSVSFICRCG